MLISLSDDGKWLHRNVTVVFGTYSGYPSSLIYISVRKAYVAIMFNKLSFWSPRQMFTFTSCFYIAQIVLTGRPVDNIEIWWERTWSQASRLPAHAHIHIFVCEQDFLFAVRSIYFFCSVSWVFFMSLAVCKTFLFAMEQYSVYSRPFITYLFISFAAGKCYTWRAYIYFVCSAYFFLCSPCLCPWQSKSIFCI